ncbi:hypothetical protein AWB90_19595 [Mycobacterium paraense]|uniref:Uncharacterized protein n=1 Tax=Mycobacterium paraense TaxID=767916 RepID=A0A1X2A6V5_9MYCO|nr:hypothetical protein AWB90_19595 [Mycobacterium paraense]
MPTWRTVLTAPVAIPASATGTNCSAMSDVNANRPPRPSPATTEPAMKCVHWVSAVTPVISHSPTAIKATPPGIDVHAGK